MASSHGADEAALDRSFRVFEPADRTDVDRILKETKQVMDKLGVTFFLRQGTCLGAIRDKGFIPWDDDIDLGCVIGLHGFTEKSIDQVAAAFRDNGHFVKVDHYDHYIAVTTIKASIRTDWACYKILDDSIFHFPGIRIPVRLLTRLKEIDFIGETFLVPNPPEEYLRLKYGDDWMTPKETGYEKDILQLIPAAPLPGRPGRLRQLLSRFTQAEHLSSLKVLNANDEPVSGAGVLIPGLGRFKTNKRGYAKFLLAVKDWYSLIISYGTHEETLYQEMLAPGASYIYRPDPSLESGRLWALTEE